MCGRGGSVRRYPRSWPSSQHRCVLLAASSRASFFLPYGIERAGGLYGHVLVEEIFVRIEVESSGR